MSPKANYHIHSHYCDGQGKLEEIVIEAIRKGLKYIGISSHAPLPFTTSWTMKPELISKYKQEIQLLKTKYTEKIEILSGLEVDYIPQKINPHSVSITSHKFDYIIVNEHFNQTVEKIEKIIFVQE